MRSTSRSSCRPSSLLPTAPIRILDIGGSTFVAGLFVGLLTYASAVSAPFTGATADRLGLRRTLIICSLAILVASVGYAVTRRPGTMLVLVVIHGVFWSGLLTSAGAYAMSLMPPARRAEGIGYWGISTVLAVAVAPTVGLWIYRYGWFWVCVSCAGLNVAMALIAWRLPEHRAPHAPAADGEAHGSVWHEAIEWRVTLASVTLFLLAFGYGGVMSFAAVYARDHGISPPGLYFTLMAVVMLITRPISGPLADRFGPAAVLVPCIVLASFGYALLAAGDTLAWFIASALAVGVGFGRRTRRTPRSCCATLTSGAGRRRSAASSRRSTPASGRARWPSAGSSSTAAMGRRSAPRRSSGSSPRRIPPCGPARDRARPRAGGSGRRRQNGAALTPGPSTHQHDTNDDQAG